MRFRLAALLSLLVTMAAGAARAAPALEVTPGIYTVTNVSVGWEFETNSAVSIDALDAIDPNGGTVQIYTGSGTILAQATILATDPVEGSPVAYYSQAITPITLAANTDYYISQTYGGQNYEDLISASGVVTDPSITYLGGVIGASSATPTSDVLNGSLAEAYFAPNFDIGTGVPEPSAWSLLGFGAAAIWLVRRPRGRAATLG